jgi:hypothetical protein
MEKLAKHKSLFIGLSCTSICCLVGSFAYPLQKLEVWQQVEKGAFQKDYKRRFVLTESDLSYPYGFSKDKAEVIAKIYKDSKQQKVILVIAAFTAALTALGIGSETCLNDEIDSEVIAIKATGRKQLLLEAVKHRLAMASKSQRLLFLDEMKALVAEFGSPEGEILEADELNATDKFTNAGYLLSEGIPIDAVVTQVWGCRAGSGEHRTMKQKLTNWQREDGESDSSAVDFRTHFPETMDGTSWKAISKALAEGVGREDIIADVLGCRGAQAEVGEAYLDYLLKKCFQK